MGYTHSFKQHRDLTDDEFGFLKTMFIKLVEAPRPIGARIEGAMYFHEDCKNLPCEIAPETDCGWIDFFTHESDTESMRGSSIVFNGAWPSKNELKKSGVVIPAGLSADYETFAVHKLMDCGRDSRTAVDEAQWHFCKTGGRPYDLFVVAMLAMMKLAAPDAFTIYTDGETEDWVPGMEFLARSTKKHLIYEVESGSGEVAFRAPTPEELTALSAFLETPEGRKTIPSPWKNLRAV